MRYQIITTSEAERTFNQNLSYLAEEWNEKVIDKFINRVDEVIDNIKDNPLLYPLYEYEKNVRKAIIDKHIILFYRINEPDSIELLTFWNTSRNPKFQQF